MLSDAEILAPMSEGRTLDTFNLLVKTYSRQMYWQIRRMVISHDDADDVLQNALIKVWNALPQFRSESRLSTWLYRIAANESLTFLAARREHLSLSDVSEDDETDLYLLDSLASDPYFSGDDAERLLQEAILHLPEKQRLVFNLKYFEDMKYEDMSRILDTSVGALKASYHFAVQKVERYLSAVEIPHDA